MANLKLKTFNSDISNNFNVNVNEKNQSNTIKLLAPKYGFKELENISASDKDFSYKLQKLYNVDENLANLYSKRYKIGEKINYRKNPNFGKDLLAKYKTTPPVNILSYGGEYQKYDDLINKVLKEGNDDGKFNNEINSALQNLFVKGAQKEYPLDFKKRLKKEFEVFKGFFKGDQRGDYLDLEYNNFLKSLKNYKKSNFLERIGKSSKSLFLRLAGSPLYAAETAGQGLSNLLNKQNKTVSRTSTGSILLGEAQKQSQEATEGLTGTQRFLYNTGESIANNLAHYAIFGGLAPVSLGLQAGTESAYEATEKGGTFGQALTKGLASGAFEGLFEKLSLGNLKALKTLPANTTKTFVKNIAKQSAVEFSEEAATEVANILTDIAVMKDKSDMVQYFNNYLKENPEATNNQALWRTVSEALKQIGEAGLSGAISGGVLGTGGQLLGRAKLGTDNLNINTIREYSETIENQLINNKPLSKNAIKEINNASKNLKLDYELTENSTQEEINKMLSFTVRENEFSTTPEGTNAIRKALFENKTNYSTIKTINEFAKSKNANIDYFYDENSDVGGFQEGDKIKINIASETNGYKTAVHEYAHFIEKNNPEFLNDYINQIDYLIKNSPKYKKLAEKITNAYKANEKTKNISDLELKNEVAFNISEKLINDVQTFNNIVTKNKTFGQKVVSFLKGLYNRVKGTSLTKEEKAIKNALNSFEKLITKTAKPSIQKKGKKAFKIVDETKDIKKQSKKTLHKKLQAKKRQIEVLKESAKLKRQIAKEKKELKISQDSLLKSIKEIKKEKYKAYSSKAELGFIDDIIKTYDDKSKFLTDKTMLNLQALAIEYAHAKETDPDFIPKKIIEQQIDRLGKQQIGDMSKEQIDNLELTVSSFLDYVKKRNKIIKENKEISLAKFGDKAFIDIKENKNTSKTKVGKLRMAADSPKEFFNRLENYSDGSFSETFKDIESGQEKTFNFQKQTYDIFKSFMQKNKKEIKNWTGKKAKNIDIGLKYKDGTTAFINEGMLISMYLHSKNNDNLRHIKEGGFVIPNLKQYNKGEKRLSKTTEPITLKPSEIKKILKEHLTDKQKQFADLTNTFFNDLCRKNINETSQKLYGLDKASVKNYFPIVSSNLFLSKDFGAYLTESSLENIGILKQRETGTNPIVLEDVFDVIIRHSQQVGAYTGLAIPIRNLNTLLNYSETEKGIKLKGLIENKFGTESVNYIDKLVRDLNGQKLIKEDVITQSLSKVRRLYSQAVLGLNLKVMLNQPASLVNAMIYIKPKNLIKGFANFVKLIKTKESRQKLNTEMENVSSAIWYRGQGNITAETGDLRKNVLQKSTSWVTAGISAFDKFAISIEYLGAKEQIKQTSKHKEGSKEFNNELKELINRTIYDTQPNYDVLHRPELLRSDSELTRSVFMFKTQLFQNRNLLFSSYRKLQAAKQTNNKTKIEEAKKNMAKTVSSVFVQGVIIALIATSWRKIKNKDKEGEFFTNLVNSTLSNFLGGSEVLSLLKGYDLENISLSAINDIVKSFNGLKDVFDKNKNVDISKKIKKLAESFALAVGIPLKNVLAWLDIIQVNSEKKETKKYSRFWDSENINAFYKELKPAIDKGNEKDIDKILNKYFDKNEENYSKEIQNEISRLIKEVPKDKKSLKQYTSILPKSVKYVYYDDKKYDVSNEDKIKHFNKSENLEQNKIAISSVNYKYASDLNKIKILTKINSFYKTEQKRQFLKTKGIKMEVSKNHIDIKNCTKYGFKIGNFISLILILNQYKDTITRQGTVLQTRKTKIEKYLNKKRYTTKQKQYIMQTLGYKTKNKTIKFR